MSATAGRAVSAIPPGDLERGMVLVADELRCPHRPPVPCPAAPLLAGELRRRGLPVRHGPLRIGGAGEGAGAAAILPAGEGETGLGAAAAPDDPAGRAAAEAAVASCRAAASEDRRTALLAAPRSFCAGVDRAIDIVDALLRRRDAPIYVRKQIVHNRHVVSELEERGAVFVDELDAVPDGATVVFSAHGVSPAVRAEAERRGLEVVDATCPLVTKVHTEARRFAARGDTVVLIGHAGHEEVDGTLGEAPESTVLVQDAAEAAALEVEDPTRVSYLTQTTLATDETDEVVRALRDRFPHLRGPRSDDICYATTNRQDALRAITRESDLVLVVGSPNSSNSLRLVELARRNGVAAHLVDDTGDIRPEWLAGTTTIGLTAGASAPSRLVDDVVSALAGLGPLDVAERTTTTEDVHFTLPPGVRSA